jgi:chromosome segregation ATPase
MSQRRSTLLATGFALSATLCLVLLGVGVYGYQLYTARGERLAALEAGTGAPAAPAASDATAGTVVERMRSDEQQIETLRADLAAAEAASRLARERAEREQEALRLKLEHAERLRLDAEAAVDAANSRIGALETELGAGGSVDALIDANGQPLAEIEAVSPGDLATLGMELRLVQRERDGARLQLDRALERITALEAASSGESIEAVVDGPAAAQQVTELESANEALRARVEALETSLAEGERQRASLEAAAATARAELQARAGGEGEDGEATGEARLAEVEQSLATMAAERDALAREQAALAAEARALAEERDGMAERLAASEADRERLADRVAALEAIATARAAELDALTLERDAAVAAADEAASRLAAKDGELASLTEELTGERGVAGAAAARIAALEGEIEALEAAAAADRNALTASLEAERAAAADLNDRLAELAAALATADAEAERATTLAAEATILAERAAEGDRSVAAERDAALARAAAAEALTARLREESATLERATRDALDSQSAAHAAAIAELEAERDELRRQVDALETERVRLVGLDGTDVAGDPGAASGDAVTAAALRAANERIAALEAELEATVRLAAELGPQGSADGDGATASAAPALPSPASGEAALPTEDAPLEAALAQLKSMDQELTDTRSRLTALQDLMFAEWPVRPRPAPR